MDAINFNFSCNNVKGLQKSKNYLQLLFQKKIKNLNGILFLEDTHYTKENEIMWKD